MGGERPLWRSERGHVNGQGRRGSRNATKGVPHPRQYALPPAEGQYFTAKKPRSLAVICGTTGRY
jgi:hypothetical protein